MTPAQRRALEVLAEAHNDSTLTSNEVRSGRKTETQHGNYAYYSVHRGAAKKLVEYGYARDDRYGYYFSITSKGLTALETDETLDDDVDDAIASIMNTAKRRT